MNIKISVVIPTYNRPSLLLNCLRNLENQSLEKNAYEVIIASDGPDINTKTAMKSWLLETDLNAEYIPSEEKKGPASTRNRGWLCARAPLIAFTDDDCLPDKDWLRSILDRYHKENLIAFTGTTQVPLPKQPTDFAKNLSKLGEADFITANCACTKEALFKVGGFDERFRMAWREDSDLEFKLISLDIPIHKVNNAVVVHPINSVRWGVSVFEQKKGIYDALLFKKHPKLYRAKIQARPNWRYYLTVSVFAGLLLSIILKFWIGILLFSVLYITSLLLFTLKRLKATSNSTNHIIEMLSTSIVIPFLSIYYRLYGAVKFRIPFF